MMKTLITGASGFVGSAVLRQLLAAGHNVRALIRPKSDRRNLTRLPVEIVYGDVTDRRSLDRAMVGCSTLFHVAADYRLWIPKPSEIYETKAIGTRNIMLAALNAGSSVLFIRAVSQPSGPLWMGALLMKTRLCRSKI